MPVKKLASILALTAIMLMTSLPLENAVQAAGRDQRFSDRHKPFDQKRMFEELRENHPEIAQMMQNLKEMRKEARMLVHEYRNQASPEQRREIEDRLRFLLEDILRHQHAITEITLDNLAERYERLRERHHDNVKRFDAIVEQRFNALLEQQ